MQGGWSAECRADGVRNAEQMECRMQSAECRVQSAECRVKESLWGGGNFCEANLPRSEAEFAWIPPKTNNFSRTKTQPVGERLGAPENKQKPQIKTGDS